MARHLQEDESGAASAAGAGPDGLAPGDLAFVTRGVSAAEAAAVTATISALLREESDARRAVEHDAPDAWQLSQRGLRTPHHPGPGHWRGFQG